MRVQSKRIFRTLDKEILPCSVCKQELPTTEFYVHNGNGASRFMPACKTCSKEATKQRASRVVFQFKNYTWSEAALRAVRHKYNITNEQFFSLVKASNGVCPVCNATFKSTKSMHVDHCHVTGKVRGLVCGLCNRLLGHAHDDITTLQNAIRYLENTTERDV